MDIIYQIGSVLFWPFSYYIGEIVVIIAIPLMCVFAKRKNKLGKILSWWFFGTIIFGIIASVIGKLAHQGGGYLSDSTGANPFFVIAGAMLWFAYFPIFSAIYLWIKKSKNSV